MIAAQKALVTHLCMYVVILSSISALNAQSELWFGTYTNEGGKIQQGRFHVDFNDNKIVKVTLAPYGKSPIEFSVIEHDTTQGLLKMEWPGNPNKKCTLLRYHATYYAGNWIESTRSYPMVLKTFNFQDAELQGNWMAPSAVEVKIIERTKELLLKEENWHREDNRICNETAKFSLFCALYAASVQVDQQYRHLRPAVKAVREAIETKYPKKYDHVLVDFNNSSSIQLAEVHAILDAAKERLVGLMDERK